jgi:hypothetical protein
MHARSTGSGVGWLSNLPLCFAAAARAAAAAAAVRFESELRTMVPSDFELVVLAPQVRSTACTACMQCRVQMPTTRLHASAAASDNGLSALAYQTAAL